jgi:hypothetical protein
MVGNDQLPVTVSHAVRLYAEDQAPLTIVGEVAVQANAHGSAIAAVPGSADEIAKLKLAGGVASLEQIITVGARDQHLVETRREVESELVADRTHQRALHQRLIEPQPPPANRAVPPKRHE